jgi:hypothetical protein
MHIKSVCRTCYIGETWVCESKVGNHLHNKNKICVYEYDGSGWKDERIDSLVVEHALVHPNCTVWLATCRVCYTGGRCLHNGGLAAHNNKMYAIQTYIIRAGKVIFLRR